MEKLTPSIVSTQYHSLETNATLDTNTVSNQHKVQFLSDNHIYILDPEGKFSETEFNYNRVNQVDYNSKNCILTAEAASLLLSFISDPEELKNLQLLIADCCTGLSSAHGLNLVLAYTALVQLAKESYSDDLLQEKIHLWQKVYNNIREYFTLNSEEYFTYTDGELQKFFVFMAAEIGSMKEFDFPVKIICNDKEIPPIYRTCIKDIIEMISRDTTEYTEDIEDFFGVVNYELIEFFDFYQSDTYYSIPATPQIIFPPKFPNKPYRNFIEDNKDKSLPAISSLSINDTDLYDKYEFIEKLFNKYKIVFYIPPNEKPDSFLVKFKYIEREHGKDSHIFFSKKGRILICMLFDVEFKQLILDIYSGCYRLPCYIVEDGVRRGAVVPIYRIIINESINYYASLNQLDNATTEEEKNRILKTLNDSRKINIQIAKYIHDSDCIYDFIKVYSCCRDIISHYIPLPGCDNHTENIDARKDRLEFLQKSYPRIKAITELTYGSVEKMINEALTIEDKNLEFFKEDFLENVLEFIKENNINLIYSNQSS